MSLNLNWRRKRIWAAVGGIGLGLLACVTPPLETPQTQNQGVGRIYVPQNLKNKVDILFLIDNSNSMEAMTMELRNRIPSFLDPFAKLAENGTYADMHIGVITSDYGAGATGAPGCSQSPGGQQGRLQGIGVKAPQNCKKPTGGVNFISFAYDKNGPGTNNLPMNQNLAETFQCMASVGASGCGFEHQLEAVYAALHNNLPENQGFLREDALLVVVFLTNEDDASAPPDTDVFDKNKTAQYGYEDSYSRQTRFAVMCCPPGSNDCRADSIQFPPYADSGGPLAGCQAAPNFPTGAGPGKQYDISRYIDFFSKVPAQGGVKTNPLDVVLVGIDGAEEPFQVILSNPGTPAGQAYAQCPQLNESANPPCVPVLQHSCQNPVQPEFFGDPAVRLNTVIRSAKKSAIGSICDSNYAVALDSAAKEIVSALGGGCIPSAFPKDKVDPMKLDIQCTVEDVTSNPDGTTTVVSIPQCPENGPNPGQDPCWRIEPKNTCASLSPDGVGLTIDRAGQPAPDHTTAQVSCAFQG